MERMLMDLGPARALAMFGVLAVAAAPIACVDHVRAEPGTASAHAGDEQRDRQLAWLGYWQGQLAAQANVGGDAEREALRRRIALLEAENAALAARLDRAEQRLASESAAAPRSASIKRRLDPMVPYDLRQPPASGKQEGTIFRRATRPARQLDPIVPYEPGARASTQVPSPAPPVQRTLDEDVPY